MTRKWSSFACIGAMGMGVALACGCASTPERPAVVNHPVFFVLHDSADADELIRDCDEMLAQIPVVVSYYAGKPLDTGRANVLSDYHVGIYVGFDSIDDYQEYVDHPLHKEIVAKWGPRCESILVRDVLDESP